MSKFEDLWDEVEEVLEDAKAITWDECHKIYILMDAGQVTEMAREGYYLAMDTPKAMLSLVKEWYDKACPLKFVEVIKTGEDGEAVFTQDGIPQGAEEDYCKACKEEGANYTGYCEDCIEDFNELDEIDEDEEEEEV